MSIFQFPWQYVRDGDGEPLPGAKAYFYLSGTSTPLTTYADSARTVARTNPVVADGDGVFPATYLQRDKQYKVILKDADGVTLYSADPVNELINARYITYSQTAAESSAGVVPSDYSYEPGNPLRYGATGDGAVDDSAAVVAAISSGSGLYLPAGYTFLANGLTISDSTRITGGGKLLAKSGDDMLTITGTGAHISLGDTNLANVNVGGGKNSGVVVSGDENVIRGTFRNLTVDYSGSDGSPSAVVLSGDRNFADIRVFDTPANYDGSGNGSFPRALTISGEDNAASVYVEDGNCGVVLGAASLRPRLGSVVLRDMSDNGIYDLGTTDGYVESFTYTGTEEAIVTKGDLHIGTAHISIPSGGTGNAAIGLEDCGTLTIDDLYIVDEGSSNGPNPIRLRAGNTSSDALRIGRCHIIGRGCDRIFSLTTGTLKELTIDDLLVELYYTDITQLKQIINWSLGEKISIGRFRVRIYDETATLSGDAFSVVIPTLSKASFIAKPEVYTDFGGTVTVSNSAQALLRFIGEQHIGSSATYDPASISAGAVETTTVTVTGAEVGDYADASFSDSTTTDADKVAVYAKVTAADTVTVYFHNHHSGAVDLASGTLRVRVRKQ